MALHQKGQLPIHLYRPHNYHVDSMGQGRSSTSVLSGFQVEVNRSGFQPKLWKTFFIIFTILQNICGLPKINISV